TGYSRMLTELFNFALPPDLIALRPSEPRDAAKLLVVQENGEITHHRFRDLPDLLKKGDVLSFNDTKVIKARLAAQRPSRVAGGAQVDGEVPLHRKAGQDRYKAFAQPARRLRSGDTLAFEQGLEGEILDRQGPEVLIGFNRTGTELDKGIAAVGQMPLPPYIAKLRSPDAQDYSDYQTVYARQDGSVAAPTAGLHFTP